MHISRSTFALALVGTAIILATTAGDYATTATGNIATTVGDRVGARGAVRADGARLIIAIESGVHPNDLSTLHASQGARLVKTLVRLDVDVVELTAAGDGFATSMAAYAASPLVRWVEPEHTWHVVGGQGSLLEPRPGLIARENALNHRLNPAFTINSLLQVRPNDPRFAGQWHLPRMRVPEAWEIGRAEGVVIAIVDTGVDCTHPDLAAACVAGWNTRDGGADTHDVNRHGTIQAGAAAAVVDNGEGVAGVAWGAKIMPLKALSDRGGGHTSDIAEAIVWATDAGADIINLSLSGHADSEVMRQAVAYAIDRGALLFAAAGNMPTHYPQYPASYDGVVGVAATTRDDDKASFSNTGAHVDLSAPGVSILTTTTGRGYAPFDGTSEATALASGVAALVLAQAPGRDSSGVIARMQSTAVDLGTPGRDDVFGHGRIDAAAALAVDADDPDDDADDCPRAWSIRLHAFPDVSGQRTAGWPPTPAKCKGCDGIFSAGDRSAGATLPLGPLRVHISPVAEPAAVIAEVELDGRGTAYGAAEAHVTICFPPPYRLTMTTVATSHYTLCDNSPETILIGQTAFDRARGSRHGTGHWATVSWGFSRCSR